MVKDSGTPSCTHALRPLNQPRPMQVQVRNGFPVALVVGKTTHRVAHLQDMWIVEDEWWRQPISRQYFAILTENGMRHTIYHDRVADRWYAQDY